MMNAKILNQHVTLPRQVSHDLTALLFFEINDDRALASICGDEVRSFLEWFLLFILNVRWPPLSRIITVFALHFYHFSAEI